MYKQSAEIWNFYRIANEVFCIHVLSEEKSSSPIDQPVQSKHAPAKKQRGAFHDKKVEGKHQRPTKLSILSLGNHHRRQSSTTMESSPKVEEKRRSVNHFKIKQMSVKNPKRTPSAMNRVGDKENTSSKQLKLHQTGFKAAQPPPRHSSHKLSLVDNLMMARKLYNVSSSLKKVEKPRHSLHLKLDCSHKSPNQNNRNGRTQNLEFHKRRASHYPTMHKNMSSQQNGFPRLQI